MGVNLSQATLVDVLYSDGDLGWRREALIAEESRKGIPAMETGDINGDGRLDIVALTGEGEVWVITGSDQGWVREESPELPQSLPGCQGYDVHLIDIDGQTGDEIIASFAGESTGYPGIPDLSHAGCQREGSVRAWRATPAEAPPADASASSP